MSIEKNIQQVKESIRKAAESAGRNPSDIKLLAVTKTKPIEMLKEAKSCGLFEFGENRPQEIVAKFPHFQGGEIKWHLIGQLQKNKVRHIIDKVCLIHSVDSLELALEIDKRAKAIGKVQDILLQINITGEESKSGIAKEEAQMLCRQIAELENVRIKGLMTISVLGMSYEENYSVFSQLKILADKIKALDLDGVFLEELSMGMTHDMDAAIAAGATIVRVGTAIFGARDIIQ